MKQSAFISALKFVAHAKAKNDVRYYLNSVKLEFKAGVLTLIATDGHRMAWAEAEAPDMPDGEYLLNGAHVDTVLKTFKANSTGTLVFDFQEHELHLRGCDCVVVARYVDGKFPDWRRVTITDDPIPGQLTPKSKRLNCDYLADAGKAFKGLAGKWGQTIFDIGTDSGMGAVRLSTVPAVAGVLTAQCIIMPMRGDK